MRIKTVNRTNISISLLKMFLAFEVILAHACNFNDYNSILVFPFRYFVTLAVPIFFMIAFYYSAPTIVESRGDKEYQRLRKLATPLLFWAIVYYLVYSFVLNRNIGVADLFYQVITGHSSKLNPTMWFQFDIIVIDVFCYFLFKIFNKKAALFTLGILSIVALYLQLNGTNYSIFSSMIFELKFPLGRLMEMLPYAFIGISLRYFDVLDRLKKHCLVTIAICVTLFIAGVMYDWKAIDSFGYGGLAVLYLSFFPFVLAYVTPLDRLPKAIKKLLIGISSYTLGIYCIHRLVNAMMTYYLPDLALVNIPRCIVIYLLSYIICFIISKIFGNFSRMIV